MIGILIALCTSLAALGLVVLHSLGRCVDALDAARADHRLAKAELRRALKRSALLESILAARTAQLRRPRRPPGAGRGGCGPTPADDQAPHLARDFPGRTTR